MENRERLERTLAGEAADRAPVALWRHFPGDDQRASDLAAAALLFQKLHEWDFLALCPMHRFSVTDYGAQDVWDGAADGARTLTKPGLERPLDWTGLRPLDPARGAIGRYLEALRETCDAVDPAIPVLATIYSPLTQAAQLAGEQRVIAHMRTQPDRLRTGLNILAETTLRFLDALRRLPIAGILYCISLADVAVIAESEYVQFGLPEDQRIMALLTPKWWFNGVQLAGHYPMMRTAGTLPAQFVAWQDQGGDLSLAAGKSALSGAVCGGLHPETHLNLGTPGAVRQATRDALASVNGRRLIVSAGGPALITTPHANLRALREAVNA